MVPWRVLPSSHEGPGKVDGRFPFDEAHDVGHGVLRGHRQQHGHVLPHHMSLFHTTCLLRSERAKDFSQMPPQLMGERFPTRRRETHHMLRAVPRGMAERLAV
jgi:hypothetical protein